MAKNKNNSFNSKNTASGTSKNTTSTTSKTSGGSMKNSHAQVPDKGPSRSGPGGE
jgi:hypothetical protein